MNLFNRFFNQPAIRQVDPLQVQTMVSQSPRPFLLDVRMPGEYKQGHVNGAALIPLNELSQKTAAIPKGREIVCICESGSRSIAAARHLSAQGYNVSNMKGGMSDWVRSGLPVKKGL